MVAVNDLPVRFDDKQELLLLYLQTYRKVYITGTAGTLAYTSRIKCVLYMTVSIISDYVYRLWWLDVKFPLVKMNAFTLRQLYKELYRKTEETQDRTTES